MKAFHILGRKTSDRSLESDQRSQNRIPARYHAYLHAVTGAVVSECIVKDISEDGARVILPKSASLPERIMICVTGEMTPIGASVAWQTGTKCGLEFNYAGCD
jgi:hypothetical protein